ncbi:MAG: toll/interleukin-1 receptor domain-containing protein, partial [Tepidisphaeraceae bacterium]
MAHDVFISYSTKDKPIADAVCATLESTGVRCWVAPRDIQPGADWGEAIVDAIAQSRLFILIFSRHANESPQVKRELQHGFDSGVVVIPFRIEDILPSKSLDYYLGSVHWLDALSTPLESHLQTLAAKTKGLLQGSKREQDPPPLPPVPPHIPHTADPPAPPPIVPPPRKSSPAIWIALAGIAVIGVIAIFLIYRLTNHPGSTPPPP